MWQAEPVDPWIFGPIAVVVVGLAVIVFGALWDRNRNQRAAAKMLAPPARQIPQFNPDSPAPTYLSDLQARRLPDTAPATELSKAEREMLARELRDPATTKVDAGYVSKDFVTDPESSWAVLDDPRVLVCSDPIESTRELLTIVEKMILSRTSLVIVAPSLADEVRGTLEVNQIRQTMRVLAIGAPRESDRNAIARTTGAQLVSRSDLQAGYVPLDQLGTCRRWVSTAKSSFLLGGAGSSQGPS